MGGHLESAVRVGGPAASEVSRSTDKFFIERQSAMKTDNPATLIAALTDSPIYQEYERAFTAATGLPVVLRPVETWQLPHHGHAGENPFCALMAEKSRTCAACLQTHQLLSETARVAPVTVNCSHGMAETAVPVRIGDRIVGLLQTGQVFRKAPTEAQFRRTVKLLQDWGVTTELAQLHELYYGTQVVSRGTYEGIVALLGIFSQQLSAVSNQIILQRENGEPPMIRHAKEYLAAHYTEPLSLTVVSKAVHTSTFYLCKMFKHATGINFTQYLSRVRVEKAVHLLLNPNLRISEVAFEVGFQSLTHFNRVFKKIHGQSPTEYRAKLPRG